MSEDERKKYVYQIQVFVRRAPTISNSLKTDIIEAIKGSNVSTRAMIDEAMDKANTTILERMREESNPEFEQDFEDEVTRLSQIEAEVYQEQNIRNTSFADWLKTEECKQSLRMLFSSPDLMSPGHAACVRWFQNQVLEAKKNGKSFSAITPDPGTLDRNMTPFAKGVARFAYFLEDLLAIDYLHQECTFSMIWTLGIFDGRMSKIKNHVMWFGTHSGGKSHMQNMIKKIAVPGMFEEISYSTEKAWTTNKNMDNTVLMYDELPASFFQEDDANQGGNTMLKGVLTSKTVKTQAFSSDDSFGRYTKNYEARMDVSMMGNSNAVPSSVPSALRSRLLIFPVVRIGRKGEEMIVREMALNARKDDSKTRDKITYESQLLITLVSMVEGMIKAGFLPDVCMVGQSLHLAEYKAHLASNAITLDPRRTDQTGNAARSNCLYEAVRRVFFTEDFFPAGTEFKFHHLFMVKPFLYVTEEHLIFAITQLEPILVDPVLDRIVTGVFNLCDLNTPVINEAKFLEEDNGLNYDYIFLETKNASSTKANERDDQVVRNAARKIVENIRSVYRIEINYPHVVRCLEMLMDEDINARGYSGPAQDCERTGVVQQYVAKTIHHGLSKHGIAISRAFLTGKRDRVESFVVDAIRASATRFTPERRLLLGQSIRDQDQMYPFLFKTFSQKPNVQRPTVVPNLRYRGEGFRRLLVRFQPNENTQEWIEEDEHQMPTDDQKMYLYPEDEGQEAMIAEEARAAIPQEELPIAFTLDCCVDEYCYREFCRENNIVRRVANFPVAIWQDEPAERYENDVVKVGPKKRLYPSSSYPGKYIIKKQREDEEKMRFRGDAPQVPAQGEPTDEELAAAQEEYEQTLHPPNSDEENVDWNIVEGNGHNNDSSSGSSSSSEGDSSSSDDEGGTGNNNDENEEGNMGE